MEYPQLDTFDVPVDSFELLLTIRYDPGITEIPPVTIEDVQPANFFLLPEHVERMKFTVSYFASQAHLDDVPEINADTLFTELKHQLGELGVPVFSPMKIRLLVLLTGPIRVEFYPVPPKDNLLMGLEGGEPWDVYVAPEAVLPSPFTSFKTTRRDVYNQARTHLPGLRPGKEEVLLVNTNDNVMEGSITNVALRAKSGHWITPKLTSGCLCGVMRHFLLRKNYIKEETIKKLDLREGAEILLFNGVMGVVRGKIARL